MSVLPILLILITLSSAAAIRAKNLALHRQHYIFKPLSTLLIILLALLAPAEGAVTYRWGMLIGLFLSLAGDIFLMLPSDKFLAGLVSFLLAHIAYIIAFTQTGWGVALWLAVPLSLAGGLVYWQLWPGLGEIKVPAFIYMLAILIMAWQAGHRWQLLGGSSATIAFVGALLFVISDVTLALNRFRQSFATAETIVLSTYYAAQTCLALSLYNLL